MNLLSCVYNIYMYSSFNLLPFFYNNEKMEYRHIETNYTKTITEHAHIRVPLAKYPEVKSNRIDR
jgi:hypothetical protein